MGTIVAIVINLVLDIHVFIDSVTVCLLPRDFRDATTTTMPNPKTAGSSSSKFNWAAAKAAKAAGPRAPGSKTVPEPKSPDCLLGLSFVFTGELSSFSRDEATDLAKRYGGYAFRRASDSNDDD